MNIGISLVDFTPGRMGGVETYVRNLITWLAVNDRDNRYTLVCTDHNVGYFDAVIDRVDTLVFENDKNSPRRLMRSLVRKVFRKDLIQVGVDRLNLDLLHNPFTSVRCSRYTTPLIVTFHDIQHHFYPQFFRAKEVRGRDIVYRKAAAEAGRIIADSEHTKQTLLECYNIPAEKISVVYLGVGSEYTKIPDTGFLDQERAALGLKKPFLYYPAATWLHKNHAALLKALKILIAEGTFDGELVLTGVATSAKDALLTQIAELGLRDRVRILGYLPYEKLPVLYNLARMLVFPSLFEGFGIPPLEAMACGCPVVCSNVTSLPEVGGDAASYFDPTSPDDIAARISTLWNDDAALNAMSAKGLVRAQQFSWEKTAQQTRDIYLQTARQVVA